MNDKAVKSNVIFYACAGLYEYGKRIRFYNGIRYYSCLLDLISICREYCRVISSSTHKLESLDNGFIFYLGSNHNTICFLFYSFYFHGFALNTFGKR